MATAPLNSRNIIPVASTATTPFVSAFRENMVAERRNVVDVVSMYGVSILVDDTSATTGTGASVAETGGEIRLQSGTDASGVASLVTKHRLVYVPDHSGEGGIGIRIPTNPTGSQVIRWGIFDSGNGFGWGVDATGQFTFIRRGGADTLTRYGSWTEYPEVIDLSAGVVMSVRFTWYGYGTIEWLTLKENASVKMQTVINRAASTSQTSVIDPNQPITVEVRNGGVTASNLSCYVGGRSIQVLGDRPVAARTLSVVRQNITVPAAASPPTPHIAIRKASTFRGRPNSVNVYLESLSAIAASDSVLIRLWLGSTITGGSWVAPPNVTTGETACEVSITPVSMSGGTQLGAFFVPAGGGGSKTSDALASAIRNAALGESETFALSAEQVAGGGAATAWISLDWTEQW